MGVFKSTREERHEMGLNILVPVRRHFSDIYEVRVLGKPHSDGMRVMLIEGGCESINDFLNGRSFIFCGLHPIGGE